jgi:hypothetical protein
MKGISRSEMSTLIDSPVLSGYRSEDQKRVEGILRSIGFTFTSFPAGDRLTAVPAGARLGELADLAKELCNLDRRIRLELLEG